MSACALRRTDACATNGMVATTSTNGAVETASMCCKPRPLTDCIGSTGGLTNGPVLSERTDDKKTKEDPATTRFKDQAVCVCVAPLLSTLL